MNEHDMQHLHDSGDESIDALLGAARRGAAPDELMHMDAVLDRFTAVAAGGVHVADATDGVTTPSGARSILSGRIPRRAAAIVVATMFAAGTAAAAAGGVLPSPFSAADDPVLVGDTVELDGTSVDDSVADDATDDTGADDTDDGASVDTDGPDDAASPDHSQSERDFGNCQAWLNGAENDPASPAFAHLADEADEAGVTIDEYCAALVDDHGRGSDHTPDDDSPDDAPAGSRPTMPSLPEKSRGDDHPTGSAPSDRGGVPDTAGRSGSTPGGRADSGDD